MTKFVYAYRNIRDYKILKKYTECTLTVLAVKHDTVFGTK
jgi:hypothetical protein